MKQPDILKILPAALYQSIFCFTYIYIYIFQDTFGESAAIGCCWEAGHPREEAAIGAGIKEGGATSTEVPQAPKDGDIKGQTYVFFN